MYAIRSYYDLRFLKPVDTVAFAAMAARYRRVVIAEEGVLTGGVASDLAAAVSGDGRAVVALGFDEKPLPQARRDELLAAAGLSAGALAAAALALARPAGAAAVAARTGS